MQTSDLIFSRFPAMIAQVGCLTHGLYSCDFTLKVSALLKISRP